MSGTGGADRAVSVLPRHGSGHHFGGIAVSPAPGVGHAQWVSAVLLSVRRGNPYFMDGAGQHCLRRRDRRSHAVAGALGAHCADGHVGAFHPADCGSPGYVGDYQPGDASTVGCGRGFAARGLLCAGGAECHDRTLPALRAGHDLVVQQGRKASGQSFCASLTGRRWLYLFSTYSNIYLADQDYFDRVGQLMANERDTFISSGLRLESAAPPAGTPGRPDGLRAGLRSPAAKKEEAAPAAATNERPGLVTIVGIYEF